MTNSIAKAITEANGTAHNVKGEQGMTPTENTEQVTKAFNAQLQQDSIDADLDTTVTTTPSGENIPKTLHDIMPEFVDRTFFSTWTDMFRVANLIELEYGVLPGFHEAGRAWQAAQDTESFAFDKDTVAPNDANDTEGLLTPMTWAEIQAKRAEGKKPMSNGQYQFFIETSERVLNGMSILHVLKDLGYQSQHTAEDVWQAAKENEEKRQKAYADRQELESRRKAESSEKALKEAVDNGSLIM